MLQLLQMLYKKHWIMVHWTLEFDPLFDGDVNIEESALETHDNANHQDTTTHDHGDLQAALLMIQTTFCLGDE